eukprot:scaffold8136_cov127-Cylindrotheca_fusiformis.AAC.14
MRIPKPHPNRHIGRFGIRFAVLTNSLQSQKQTTIMIFHHFLFFAVLGMAAAPSANAQGDYGLDCSWPIHSTDMKCGNLLGDRKKVYEEYLQGCREKWGAKGARRCDEAEAGRLDMSIKQPQSMVNYTDTGFKKIKAPPELWNLLKTYWEDNKDDMLIEEWSMGNIYTNNWASPTYMVSVENPAHRGGGLSMKNKIWEATRPTIEEWTGMKLQPSSQYGIRVYTEGAILAPHVDRLPLVSSCIVNVAQDVDEDWVLEVYDRHDRAVNVTMEPGDMVLYESGALMHGRPFPMKGRMYANIFIHFEPTGEHLNDEGWDDIDDFYPPYIQSNSPWLTTWKRTNPNGWKKNSPSAAAVAQPRAHSAAAAGDIDLLQKLSFDDKNALHLKDANGWQPLHEAARAGNLDVVKMLVADHNADINAVTNNGKGSSPYYIAVQSHSANHPVAKYLHSKGATYKGPNSPDL